MSDIHINNELYAYVDNELPPAERAAFAKLIARFPEVFSFEIRQLRKLDSAAQDERMPAVFENEPRAWPLLADRVESISRDDAEKLNAAARAENCPLMSGEEARRAWKVIYGRALFSFHEDHLHAAPVVSEANWNDAWKKITTRARIVALPPAQEVKAPVAAPVLKTVEMNSKKPRRAVSIWGWAAGVGMAAAAMLALVLYAPEKPVDPGEASASTSMAMSIPESQDERYGVLVKYVPGSDDPVICLYEKNPDSMKK